MADKAPVAAAGALRRHPWRSAVVAGLLVAAALPPVHFLPGLAGLAVPLLLLRAEDRARRALAASFLFAFTYALASLYWVAIAFWTDPTRWGPLAAPAVLGLSAAYAGIVLGLWLPLRAARGAPPAIFALLFGLAWMAGELLRASPWIRFPWNPLAAVWASSELGLGAIAYVGVSGTGVLTVVGAALCGSLLLEGQRKLARTVLGALLLATVPALGATRLFAVGEIPETATVVRLVQGNLERHHNWQPEAMAEWLARHLELTAQPARDAAPDLVVWPESAIPYDLEPEAQSAELRARLSSVLPAGAFLAAGADRFVQDDRRYELTNSLYLLDDTGRIVDRYDKVDLVPFGEFLPFRRLLRRAGLRAFTSMSIDFQPGPGRRTLVVDGLPPMSPLICYEVAFAGRATDGSGRARLLLNITNDAWFGRSSGPYQHFATARMRAVETGLPLVRAANTGMSAIIDAAGRVRASLALGERGLIDGRLPAALPPPPIARLPAIPLLVVAIVAVMCVMVDFLFRPRDEESRRAAVVAAVEAARDHRA